VGEMHAIQRLAAGFDLWTVATEYHLLRSCIMRLWLEHGAPKDSIEQMMRLDDAVDSVLTEAVSQYSQSRNRTLEAVDRISTVALEEHDIDAFLGKLITVFM